MRQATVKRLQKKGHWRDVPLQMPTQTSTGFDSKVAELEGVKPVPQLPADQLHTIYECYCELDEGIPSRLVTTCQVMAPPSAPKITRGVTMSAWTMPRPIVSAT